MKMARYSIRIKDIMENYYILKEEEKPITILDQSPLNEDNNTWDNPFNTDYQSPFDKSQPTVDEVISSTWQDLFNFTYPKLPDYSMNGWLRFLKSALIVRIKGVVPCIVIFI